MSWVRGGGGRRADPACGVANGRQEESRDAARPRAVAGGGGRSSELALSPLRGVRASAGTAPACVWAAEPRCRRLHDTPLAPALAQALSGALEGT